MKILYYLPVNSKFIKKWEYYENDFQSLKKIYGKNLLLGNSFFELLKNFFSSDIIYSWWWHRSFVILILSKNFRKKIICTGAIHMFDLSSHTTFYKKNFFYKLLNKIVLKYSDANIFISKDQYNSITSHIECSKSFYLHSSLKKKHLEIKKLKKKINNDFNFLTITWFTKENLDRKGVFEILDALKKIKNKKYKYIIAGSSGNGLNDLKKKISENNLNKNVYIKKDISEKFKERLYQNSDLFLMPSKYEGLGNSCIEAMSFGVPCLVSRYSAQPEIVSDKGFIINDITDHDISKIIMKFLNLRKEKRRQMYIKTLNYAHDKFSFNQRTKNLKKIMDIFSN